MIRTSTDYPAGESIPLHCEQSYCRVFPRRLFLCCAIVAVAGGETPLADTPPRAGAPRSGDPVAFPAVRAGLYRCTFLPHFGASWQTVYQTSDREELERYLRQAGIEWTWTPQGFLQTSIRASSEMLHPETGEPVLVQSHLVLAFLASGPGSAPPTEPGIWRTASLRSGLRRLEHRLRMPWRGTSAKPMPPKPARFPWRAGDLLIVDNMLAAHGRAPFRGPRKILFAMAEPCDRLQMPGPRRAAGDDRMSHAASSAPRPSGAVVSPQQRHVSRLAETCGCGPFIASCNLVLEGPLGEDTILQAVQTVWANHDALVGAVVPDQLTRVAADRHPSCFPRYAPMRWRWATWRARSLRRARRCATGPPGIVPGVSYQTIATWELDLLSQPESRVGIGFWREKLAATAWLVRVPGDDGTTAEFAPASMALAAPAECANRLQHAGASREVMLLACWYAVLTRLAGSRIPFRRRSRWPHGGRTTARDRVAGAHRAGATGYRCEPAGEEPRSGRVDGAARSLGMAGLLHVVRDGRGPDRTRAKPNDTFPMRSRCASRSRQERRASSRLRSSTVPPGSIAFIFVWCVKADNSRSSSIRGVSRALAVEQIGERFLTLLGAALADPARRAGEFPILIESDTRFLASRNRTERTGETWEPVHQVIARRAQASPEAIAVRSGDLHLTYGALQSHSDRLAGFLRARGAGPGALIGITSDRTPWLAVGVLGILKSGAAFLPVDRSAPEDRRAAMLAQGPAPVRARHTGSARRLDWRPCRARCGHASRTTGLCALHLRFHGKSQGSLRFRIAHLANHMRWMLEEFSFDHRDRVLQRTPLPFDPSVWELLAPLMAGAELVLAPQDIDFDGAGLATEIADRECTVLQVIPSLLRPLLHHLGERACALRKIFCGGEALSAVLSEDTRRVTGLTPVNLYGPAELVSMRHGMPRRPPAPAPNRRSAGRSIICRLMLPML